MNNQESQAEKKAQELSNPQEEQKNRESCSPEPQENAQSSSTENTEVKQSSEFKPQPSSSRRNWWEEERKYFQDFLEEQEELRTKVLSHQYLMNSVLRAFMGKVNRAVELGSRIKQMSEKQAQFCTQYLEERKRVKEMQIQLVKYLMASEEIQNQERILKENNKQCVAEVLEISQTMQQKISDGIEISEALLKKKNELTEFQNIVKHLKQAVQTIEHSEIERERDIKRTGALIGPHTPEDLFIKMKSYASLFSDKLSSYAHFIKAVIEFLFSSFAKYDQIFDTLASLFKKFHTTKAKLYGTKLLQNEGKIQVSRVIHEIAKECELGGRVESLEQMTEVLSYNAPRVDLSIFVIKQDTLKTNFKQAANWQPRELIATHSKYLYVFAPESSGKWEARFDMRDANLKLGTPDQENRELIFEINQELKEKSILSSWFSGKPTKLFVETRSVDNLIEWVHALKD